MRSIWGPLGWKTIHSVALLYPDNPTKEDRAAAEKFLNCFIACIACDMCKGHFTAATEQFRKQYDILKNKHAFFWYTVKAHNMANARLGKMQIQSYGDAYTLYKGFNHSPTRLQYIKYINHLFSAERDMNNLMKQTQLKPLLELERGAITKWWTTMDWETNMIATMIRENPLMDFDIKIQQNVKIIRRVPNSVIRK
jgi:hypothetical protein